MNQQPIKYCIFVIKCKKLKTMAMICTEENKTEEEVAHIFAAEYVKKNGIKWKKTYCINVGRTDMLFDTMEQGEKIIQDIDGDIQDEIDLSEE